MLTVSCLVSGYVSQIFYVFEKEIVNNFVHKLTYVYQYNLTHTYVPVTYLYNYICNQPRAIFQVNHVVGIFIGAQIIEPSNNI